MNNAHPFEPHVKTVSKSDGDEHMRKCWTYFQDLMGTRSRLADATKAREHLESELADAKTREKALREKLDVQIRALERDIRREPSEGGAT